MKTAPSVWNWAIVTTLMLVLLLSGCMSAAMKRPYASLASQASTAATDTKAAYTLTEDAYDAEQSDELAQRYAQRGYTPGEITVFLSSKDLRARMDAVDVLTQYGEMITAVLNPKFVPTQAKPQAAKQSTSKPKTNTKSSVPKITQAEITMADQAIQYIGEITANVKTRRQLPKAILKADPSVQAVCTLFRDDIETLRFQVHESYQTRLILENEFIRDNWDQMDALQRRAEIDKLPALEKQVRDANDALMHAQDELRRVGEQSHKLAEAYHGKK